MNLIFTAYAYDEKMQTGANINFKESMEVYLKNSFVSLKSVKLNNPDSDVMFITNVNIPDKYHNLYIKSDIKICKIDFDIFTVPENTGWGLAFFKLCALWYAGHTLKYDRIAMIDNDTYSINNFEDIWKESDDYILLYNVFHWYSNTNEKIIQKEYHDILGHKKPIIHMGGEFVCSSRILINIFTEQCLVEFGEMASKNQYTTRGDEFIVSAAADKLKTYIKSANAYIQRMWTGNGYYYSTTYMYCTPLAILHVPDEKKRGMIKLYDYYLKYNKFPTNLQIYRIFRLPDGKCPKRLMYACEWP